MQYSMNAVLFFTQTNWMGLWLKLNVRVRRGNCVSHRADAWAEKPHMESVCHSKLVRPKSISLSLNSPVLMEYKLLLLCLLPMPWGVMSPVAQRRTRKYDTCSAALLGMCYLDEHAACRMLVFELMYLICVTKATIVTVNFCSAKQNSAKSNQTMISDYAFN